ncbi:TonB family protein [Pontibacter sp. CAU 1760]
MKQTLLLPLVLFIALATAQAQQQVAVYYTQNWEVTKRENAAYTRLATIPDSLIRAGKLFKMPFDKAVADYYSSGKVLARGNYSKGQKQGDWLFYYPSGRLQCQAKYLNGSPTGTWKFWRENGQQEQEIMYEGEQVKVQSFWNENGQQAVFNGTGNFEVILPDSSNGRLQLRGAYLNGARHGTWLYMLSQNGQAATPVMQQQYHEGKLINGQTAKLGGKTTTFLLNGSFGMLQPDFSYLAMVESWNVDTTAFRPGYPVLAYMLKLNVQQTQEKKTAAHQIWAYRVVVPSATGADTLILAKQHIYNAVPEFPGGEQAMKAFLSKYVHYPIPAQYFGMQGIVILSVPVKEDGSLGEIRVVKSGGVIFDDEVIRAAKLMPPWKPALVDNVPVAASSHLAFKFLMGSRPQIYNVYWPWQ